MPKMKIRYRPDDSFEWSDISMTAMNLEDAIRQAGYVLHRMRPFTNTEMIVLNDDNIAYRASLEW